MAVTFSGKGPLLEESLRAYFLTAGYYVARGVPFVYEGFDVTDIDLWIYGRASSVSREITIVDIKNKKTPQAIERIFWTKGLQLAANADRAIVATTDKRPEVKDFGRNLDILVLDGNFLSRLENRESHLQNRLSEEEFFHLISSNPLNKFDGDWRKKISISKSLLCRKLSFDTCNSWLAQARFFAEQAVTRKGEASNALRCMYLLCSYIAVSIDYQLREISFLEQTERAKALIEGFTYGSRGRIGFNKLIDLSTSLVDEFANEGRTMSNQIRAKVEKNISNVPAGILGDFFARRDVATSLFNVSRNLEELAMSRNFTTHATAPIETKSLIGCLLDFWGIDRTHLGINYLSGSNEQFLSPASNS